MRFNAIDRAVGWFSPQRGVERARARAQLDAWAAEARSYDGAAQGRHTDGWRTASTSADTEIAAGGRRMRDRGRDLERNNPHAAKGANILASNIVGTGIMPRPKTGSRAKNKAITKAFNEWVKQCDAGGQLDFYGLQTLAVRGMVVAGESLVRRRWRRPEDGLKVPLQLQVLEPDYLDDSVHGLLSSGAKAVQGVEFDAIGRRASYWMFRDHPGSATSFAASSVSSSRVPASEILHLYEMQRTQARGATWFSPVIRRIRDGDDYDFAERIRKKTEASTVAIVTTDEEPEEGIAPRVTDSRGNTIEQFRPGMIGYARGGKQVNFNAPATIGGYEEYKRVSAREVSAGLRVPYELLTGDLSAVSFISGRIGLVEFRTWCSIVQWQIVIPMLLDPIWRWFGEAAYLAGVVDDPEIPIEWSTPKWPAIEPYKDALAATLEVRAGLKTPQESIGERGRDVTDVLDEYEEWNAEVDKRGLIFDSDPRNLTRTGVMQKAGSPPDPNAVDQNDLPGPDDVDPNEE